MSAVVTVHSLHVYPVKSLRGIAANEMRVERRGLRLDRRWMIVDAAGRFVSQREQPRLALVDVAIDEDGRRLVVRAPGMEPLEVPFEPGGARREVQIWRDTVPAVSVSDQARAYFSRYLGEPVELVHMPEDAERAVDPRHARAGDVVGFADGYAFLLASTASLDDVCRRVGQPLPMARFRPNIVVTGAPPFAEDTWESLRIGGIGFRVAKPCDRCVITTIDPETAERHKEPLATLATYRRQDNQVLFGQNLAHDGTGWLRTGDAVHVEAAGLSSTR